jgi:16S rRNA (cytosine1402-N4)-methyltransferase
MYHVPVMVREVLHYLLHDGSRRVLDATISSGGHARAILETNPAVELIGVDWDKEALGIAERLLEDHKERIHLIRASYADVGRLIPRFGKLDGVLLDLGVSSMQLDDSSRGFSYTQGGPLDMRMSGEGITAKEFIEQGSAEGLTKVLKKYGEVKRASRIARAIKDASNRGRMKTTLDLRDAVDSALGGNTSPSVLSKVYQGLRIALNGELENVQSFLNGLLDHMNKHARLVVISYHSLEDRLIKSFLKRQSIDCLCPPGVPACVCEHRATMEILTRRVVKPSATELVDNPRSRSAKLRAASVIV